MSSNENTFLLFLRFSVFSNVSLTRASISQLDKLLQKHTLCNLEKYSVTFRLVSKELNEFCET